MKTHGNECLSPRFKVTDRFPYVRMGVSLTAVRVSLSGVCCRSHGVGGMTLTSEPVSMRKLMHKLLSLTKIGDYGMMGRKHLSPLASSLSVSPSAWVFALLGCISELCMIPTDRVIG